jgi:glycosyltransferase involved in cell wall biosynthesis
VALASIAPADAVILTEPCTFTEGWLERLRTAARGDTNTASASALADAGTPLAVDSQPASEARFAMLARALAESTLRLRPLLSRAVGPCVYVRREALELVGPLAEDIGLAWALEIDLARRCLLAGLCHVAADDVLVHRLVGGFALPSGPPPAEICDELPDLARAREDLALSPMLALAMRAARSGTPLSATIDARALDGGVTGTHVHILELIRALGRCRDLRLRVLIRKRRIDHDTLAELPTVELLDEEDLDESTPRSEVFHRPQQAFTAEDVELAERLGERLVLSQLDLIAYNNPGYFPDNTAWQAFRRAGRQGLAAAARVLVFSETTRNELIREGLAEDSRILVVPPGLDHGGTPAPRQPGKLEASAAGRAIAAGEQPFILCLGTDFRHKNRGFALRLLAALREQQGWSGSLVLAGTHIPHGSSSELEQALMAERPALAQLVVELGAVEEAEKAWLLSHCRAVVYPSVYEGFGLVPFEAALGGVPCLFAAQSSLAEVTPAGSATIVQWDPVDSAARCRPLLDDGPERQELIALLARHARELTWERAAAATVRAYREAALAPVSIAATLSTDVVASRQELTDAHQEVVARLISEREHAQAMYDELNARVGWGLALIGPQGALPEDVQRTLLALSARPWLSRPLYGALSSFFRALRAVGRLGRRDSGR